MGRAVAGALALLAAAGQSAPVMAQQNLPKFYVYGEDDGGADLTACKVTHQSAIDAVQAELRQDGIVIQTDANDPEAVMDVYINIAAMPITGQATCAYSLSFAFESFNEVPNPFTGRTEFTKLAYCNKGSVLIWARSTAQAEIDTNLRRHARECLAKYNSRGAR